MKLLFNPDVKFTQEDIGKLLNITGRQVRSLVQQGFLPEGKPRSGYDPLACLHAYISYKTKKIYSNNKAEVDEDDVEDLGLEEQKLKLEERKENIAMKKAKRVLFEKTYAPIEMVVDTLQQVSGQLASRLDSLIPKMKLAYPDLPPEAIEVLETELTIAANECADIRPDFTSYFDGSCYGMPGWLAGSEESNSNIGE